MALLNGSMLPETEVPNNGSREEDNHDTLDQNDKTDSDSGDSIFLTQAVTLPSPLRKVRRDRTTSQFYPSDLCEDSSDSESIDTSALLELFTSRNKTSSRRKPSYRRRRRHIQFPFLKKHYGKDCLTYHQRQIFMNSSIGGFFQCMRTLTKKNNKPECFLDPVSDLSCVEDKTEDDEDNQEDIRKVDGALFVQNFHNKIRQEWGKMMHHPEAKKTKPQKTKAVSEGSVIGHSRRSKQLSRLKVKQTRKHKNTEDVSKSPEIGQTQLKKVKKSQKSKKLSVKDKGAPMCNTTDDVPSSSTQVPSNATYWKRNNNQTCSEQMRTEAALDGAEDCENSQAQVHTDSPYRHCDEQNEESRHSIKMNKTNTASLAANCKDTPVWCDTNNSHCLSPYAHLCRASICRLICPSIAEPQAKTVNQTAIESDVASSQDCETQSVDGDSSSVLGTTRKKKKKKRNLKDCMETPAVGECSMISESVSISQDTILSHSPETEILSKKKKKHKSKENTCDLQVPVQKEIQEQMNSHLPEGQTVKPRDGEEECMETPAVDDEQMRTEATLDGAEDCENSQAQVHTDSPYRHCDEQNEESRHSIKMNKTNTALLAANCKDIPVWCDTNNLHCLSPYARLCRASISRVICPSIAEPQAKTVNQTAIESDVASSQDCETQSVDGDSSSVLGTTRKKKKKKRNLKDCMETPAVGECSMISESVSISQDTILSHSPETEILSKKKKKHKSKENTCDLEVPVQQEIQEQMNSHLPEGQTGKPRDGEEECMETPAVDECSMLSECVGVEPRDRRKKKKKKKKEETYDALECEQFILEPQASSPVCEVPCSLSSSTKKKKKKKEATEFRTEEVFSSLSDTSGFSQETRVTVSHEAVQKKRRKGGENESESFTEENKPLECGTSFVSDAQRQLQLTKLSDSQDGGEKGTQGNCASQDTIITADTETEEFYPKKKKKKRRKSESPCILATASGDNCSQGLGELDERATEFPRTHSFEQDQTQVVADTPEGPSVELREGSNNKERKKKKKKKKSTSTDSGVIEASDSPDVDSHQGVDVDPEENVCLTLVGHKKKKKKKSNDSSDVVTLGDTNATACSVPRGGPVASAELNSVVHDTGAPDNTKVQSGVEECPALSVSEREEKRRRRKSKHKHSDAQEDAVLTTSLMTPSLMPDSEDAPPKKKKKKKSSFSDLGQKEVSANTQDEHPPMTN